MSQSDFIAAQLRRFCIQMTTTHSGTKIARRMFGLLCNVENASFKNRNWNIEQRCIAFYFLAVDLTIARIHHQKNKFKRNFRVTVKHLHQLCQQHRIFTTRNANCNFISRLNHPIHLQRRNKRAPQFAAEFF